MRPTDGRSRRRRALLARAAFLALGSALLGAPLAARPAPALPGSPTRDDLLRARGRVARLEAELALSSTRKPYVVLDLGERVLRYRLVGMTLRELPIEDVETRGLRAAAPGDAARAAPHAGIFSLAVKEGDPRLSPLTPEQIEAGLDDENAADVLPPEPPPAYGLMFKQPIRVRVRSLPRGRGVAGAWAKVRGWWSGLLAAGAGEPGGPATLRVAFSLDEETAKEVYRSLVPDERWLVLPPHGFALPAAGQEPLPKPRPPKEAPRPIPPPAPPGIPFRIPPPVENGNVAPAPGDGALPEGAGPAPAPSPGGEPSPPSPGPEPPPEPGSGAAPEQGQEPDSQAPPSAEPEEGGPPS